MRAASGRLWRRFVAALHSEVGQALTEYALVLMLLAAVAVALAAETGLAGSIVNKISDQLGRVL